MNEDIARLSGQLGIPFDKLKVNVKIETTYDPCNVCKRELYLFQEQFNANIEIARPFFVDSKGKSKVVRNHTEFEKLNK